MQWWRTCPYYFEALIAPLPVLADAPAPTLLACGLDPAVLVKRAAYALPAKHVTYICEYASNIYILQPYLH